MCTDQAIVDAVLGVGPETAIDEARRKRDGDFRVLSYEDFAAGKVEVTVDVVVCNFSLLGGESVEGVIRAVPSRLNPNGAFIVQTMHPIVECGDDAYRDGWREGTWAGISCDFSDPAPWFFRTVESWVNLFVTNGFQLRELLEPLHPETGKPASVIFIALLWGHHPHTN